MLICQNPTRLATRVRSVYAEAGIPVTAGDLALCAAWAALAVDVAVRRPRAPRNRVVASAPHPGALARAIILGGTLAAVAGLEWMRPPSSTPGWLTGAGVALVSAGLALHVAARRALGPWWDSVATVREDHSVIARGPYAIVRHPLYLAILLMAAGTVLAHPSVAAGAAAGGLALGTVLKIRAEEALLRRVLGEPYVRYARTVPALLPWLRRGRP